MIVRYKGFCIDELFVLIRKKLERFYFRVEISCWKSLSHLIAIWKFQTSRPCHVVCFCKDVMNGCINGSMDGWRVYSDVPVHLFSSFVSVILIESHSPTINRQPTIFHSALELESSFSGRRDLLILNSVRFVRRFVQTWTKTIWEELFIIKSKWRRKRKPSMDSRAKREKNKLQSMKKVNNHGGCCAKNSLASLTDFALEPLGLLARLFLLWLLRPPSFTDFFFRSWV